MAVLTNIDEAGDSKAIMIRISLTHLPTQWPLAFSGLHKTILQYFPKFWTYLDLLQGKKKKKLELLEGCWSYLSRPSRNMAALREGGSSRVLQSPNRTSSSWGLVMGLRHNPWRARGQSKALLTQGRADSLGLSLNGTQGYGPRWGWLGPGRPISALWALALSCKRRVIEQQQANISYHIFGESIEYGFHKSKITY